MRRISKITTPLLIFIMLFGIMKNNMLYAIYEYDTKLFVSLFCENKDKPQLHCNGKCKLTKMLKEQQEEEATKVLKQLQTEMLFCFHIRQADFSTQEKLEISEVKYFNYNQHLYSFLFITKSDKPPESSLIG